MVEQVVRAPVSDARLRALGRLLAPALIYLGVREVGVLLLGLLGDDLTRSLTAWDGTWYLAIAAGGYDGVPGHMTDTFGATSADIPMAFFPAYPTVVRIVGWFPGLSLATAGILVSAACGVAAAYGLLRLVRAVGGSRHAGYAMVALFAAAPMGVVLSMTYAEAMFCALAAWSLVFVLERNWLAAGVLCALAGLARPSAAPLVLAVGVAALWQLYRDREDRRAWIMPLLGAALAPLGLLGYGWWVGTVVRPDAGWLRQVLAWTELQEIGWSTSFDAGGATLEFALGVLTSDSALMQLVTVFVLLGGLVLLGIGCWQRVPLPLLVYAFGIVLMAIGWDGLMVAKARQLLPAFALLIPVALALDRRRTSTMVLVLGACAVASAWLGARALTVWNYAI